MNLINCPCGGTGIFDSEGSNRNDKRELAITRYEKAVKAQKKRNIPETRKELAFSRTVAESLLSSVVEISCDNCKFFIWGESEFIVENRWNRAIDKLQNLDKCCKTKSNHDAWEDTDGMRFIKCTECHRKHLPVK